MKGRPSFLNSRQTFLPSTERPRNVRPRSNERLDASQSLRENTRYFSEASRSHQGRRMHIHPAAHLECGVCVLRLETQGGAHAKVKYQSGNVSLQGVCGQPYINK